MDKIAVLIPCYNEGQTIAKVVKDYREALPEATIYVYDNNSSDHTDEIAREAGAVVRYEYQQGKGNVIRSMFRDIDAECYVMTDGDDTYPAEDARKLADQILQGKADMVIGDRLSSTYFTENKRPFHNTGNRLVRGLINLIFKSNIKDIMTGARAFNYEFVKSFPILSTGFEIETEMSIHALDKNLLIRNLPVSYRDRPEGSVSKLHTFRDGTRVLRTIFLLYKDYRPLRFFTMASLILALIALLLFIPVFHEYVMTGLVPKLPTLVTSGFFMVSAVVALGIGLVLDTEVKNSRKNLEIQMNIIQMMLKK